MVIVDTSVWIDYLADISNPQTSWLETNIDWQRVGLTDLILCEVLQGVRDDNLFSLVRRELFTLRIFETGGISLSIAAAQNYRSLRGRGHTVRKTIDCLIATFCLEERHELLHRDHDYDPFEKHFGLRVIHP